MKITEDEVNEKGNLIDKTLTWVEVILKKHWLTLILIGLGYLFYWGWNHPEEQMSNSNNVDSSSVYQDTTQLE